MIDSAPRLSIPPDTMLRWATALNAVALVVHGGDHLRRGMGSLSMLVMALGAIQQLAALVTIWLVFTRHRSAPIATIWLGFTSAAGFTVVHLLPSWFGPLSDSFINAPASANVTGFSWFAAIFEILADLGVGIAGLRARESWAATE